MPSPFPLQLLLFLLPYLAISASFPCRAALARHSRSCSRRCRSAVQLSLRQSGEEPEHSRFCDPRRILIALALYLVTSPERSAHLRRSLEVWDRKGSRRAGAGTTLHTFHSASQAFTRARKKNDEDIELTNNGEIDEVMPCLLSGKVDPAAIYPDINFQNREDL